MVGHGDGDEDGGAELFDVPSETTIDARVDGEQQQHLLPVVSGMALNTTAATDHSSSTHEQPINRRGL